ncbi:hypothetical protein LCGC14_1946870 [marine sediment metagenome]|uniref:YopX protein domain-containing protein n=1 Tax=marine sediment metagenome TaxID=412755 RepID=A0A0F9FIJ2_9ZZZZ
MKFRANISEKTIVPFTLQDLVSSYLSFSIRQLVIPWLLEGNIPDRCLEVEDAEGTEIYEHDIVSALNYPGSGEVIYNTDDEAGACFHPQFQNDETIDWWAEKERWYQLKVIGNSHFPGGKV